MVIGFPSEARSVGCQSSCVCNRAPSFRWGLTVPELPFVMDLKWHSSWNPPVSWSTGECSDQWKLKALGMLFLFFAFSGETKREATRWLEIPVRKVAEGHAWFFLGWLLEKSYKCRPLQKAPLPFLADKSRSRPPKRMVKRGVGQTLRRSAEGFCHFGPCKMPGTH